MNEMPKQVWLVDGYDDKYHGDEIGGKGFTPYLRADLAVPRPWRTVEDLEELPVGSVVRDFSGVYFERQSHCWYLLGWHDNDEPVEFSSEVVAKVTPGLILFVPEGA